MAVQCAKQKGAMFKWLKQVLFGIWGSSADPAGHAYPENMVGGRLLRS
jgi:hypothetical protein